MNDESMVNVSKDVPVTTDKHDKRKLELSEIFLTLFLTVTIFLLCVNVFPWIKIFHTLLPEDSSRCLKVT